MAQMNVVRRHSISIPVLLLLTGLASGCAAVADDTAAAATTPSDPLAQTIVVVNGKAITRGEFYQRLEETAGERVLADTIARALLSDAFDKSGLTLTEQEINVEIETMKKQAPGEQEWQAHLQQQGMDEASFRDYVAFNLKVKKMAEKDVPVTEEALRQHFRKNRETFDQPETVVLSEITVRTRAEARDLRRRLDDPGVKFADLATQLSTSTFTRERGGRRGEEPLSGLQPETLKQAVSRLQVGEVSQPVKAGDVWYIIKLDQRSAARKADFAKDRDAVREHYLFVHARSVSDLIEELRKTAQVKILDPRYEDMSRMFGPQPELPPFRLDD